MAKNRITTPKGRAVYPHLNKPDTKFVSEGVYHLKLAIPTKDAAGLVEKLTALQKEAIETAQKENPKLKKVKVADLPFVEDEETGETTFTFKMKAQVKSKKTKETVNLKPAIFDASGKPLKDAKVGGGSIVRVSFEPSGYYTATLGAGVTLRLEAVQVIELKEFGGGNAESYGFEAEEGYEADEKEDEEKTEEGAEESAGEDEGDGSDF